MEQKMDNGLGSLIEAVETDERKQRELALQKKKARFQESLQELAAIVVQFSEELGEDNEMTVMMLDFLNTCLELQDVTKLLEGVSKGIKALTDVLGVMDATQSIMDECFSMMTENVDITRQGRRERAQKLRNSMKASKVRVRNLTASIGTSIKVSQMTVKQVRKMAKGFKKKGGKGKTPRKFGVADARRFLAESGDDAAGGVSGGTGVGGSSVSGGSTGGTTAGSVGSYDDVF